MQAGAIAILIDDLRNADISVRLNSLKSVADVAVALGPFRTRSELIPFLQDMSDDEDEIINTLACKLGEFVELVGGPEFAVCLIQPLEHFCSVEDPTIRESALGSLRKVLERIPLQEVPVHTVPLIDRLISSDWFVCRVTACSVASCALRRVFHISVFRQVIQLSREEPPTVRRSALTALSELGNAVPVELIPEWISAIETISRDEEESVRAACAGSYVTALKTTSHAARSAVVNDFVRACIQSCDDHSWRVRMAFAHVIADNVNEFTGSNLSDIRSCALKYISDSDLEVRSAIIGKWAFLIDESGDESFVERLVKHVERAANDTSENVRLSLASSFSESCIKTTVPVETVLNIFLTLLRDDSSSVRLKALSHLPNLTRIINSTVLKFSILPALKELLSDRNWRLRRSVIELIPEISFVFDDRPSIEDLFECLTKFLVDAVYSVRESTANAFGKIYPIIVSNSLEARFLHELEGIIRDSNYLHRMAAISAIAHVYHITAHETKLKLNDLLGICAADKVANVRLHLLKMLSEYDKDSISTHKTLLEDTDIDVRTLASTCIA